MNAIRAAIRRRRARRHMAELGARRFRDETRLMTQMAIDCAALGEAGEDAIADEELNRRFAQAKLLTKEEGR